MCLYCKYCHREIKYKIPGMKTDGYSIKDLEVLSGIKAHTIRIWEKRYNLLEPNRTDTNIRFYSNDDLRRILNVSLLVRNGHKISKVAVMSNDVVKEKILEITDLKTSEEDYIDRLMLFMLNFDNISFYNLTQEIIEKIGLEDATLKVFFVLFARIGTYWQVGSVFPAQEHYVTSIIRQKVIAEIDKLGMSARNAKTMLFFLPELEMHEMSLLYYSYLARKIGLNVVYLGQFVPFDDLQKIQSHLHIDYVFTAFINSFPKEELEEYLTQLKSTFSEQKIFITGWQLQQNNPALPRNIKIVQDYRDFKRYLR